MYLIKKETLEMIIHAAKNTYPKEFIGLLGSRLENNVIDELILTHSEYGDSTSSIYMDSKPVDNSIIGSVHSHPTNSNNPSDEDIHSFPKFGKIHLIISYPFNINAIKMFDSKGKLVEFKVIQ